MIRLKTFTRFAEWKMRIHAAAFDFTGIIFIRVILILTDQEGQSITSPLICFTKLLSIIRGKNGNG